MVGTVRVDHAAPPGPVRITYSKFSPKHLVAPWLELLALVADDPGTDWQAVIVNRTQTVARVERHVIRPLGADPDERADRARSALAVSVECYRRSLVEPIPLFARLSKRLYDGKAGVGDWNDFKGWADGDDLSNHLAFGEFDYYELIAVPARPDDPPGAAPGRVQRFADWFWSAFDASVICSADGLAASTAGDGS